MTMQFSHYGKWVGTACKNGRLLIAEHDSMLGCMIELGTMLNELDGVSA